MNSKAKGSSFERRICQELSNWWTLGKRDDVFWRTAASGARGTVRGRAGKQTSGACGDICATDPIGEPLLRAFTFELKKGYNNCHFSSLLDYIPKGTSPHQLLQFILQAHQSHLDARSLSWAIIHQRDYQQPTIILRHAWPLASLWDQIFSGWPVYFLICNCFPPDPFKKRIKIIQMRLEDFLDSVDPADVRRIVRHHDKPS